MAMTAEQYLTQLQALLPRGDAWAQDADAELTGLLGALSEEFASIDARADLLRDEADPQTTYELLNDWERIASLPSLCMQSVPQTTIERRNALLAHLGSQGGQSRAYFIGLAAALGFVVTISEFSEFTCTTACDQPLCGGDWRFAWQINAPLETITDSNCMSPCVDPLRSWGNTLLECVISADKPAHSVVLFAYT